MKKKIIWTKKLETGMKDIDKQHQHFIGILNIIFELSKKSKNDQKTKVLSLKSALNDLVEYARVHFSTEENYFRKFSYPYINEHMIEHEKLLLKALQFKDKFDSKSNLDDIPGLYDFLTDWLEVHLKVHDFKYVKYFRDNHYI
jgi:hemerythrin